MRLIHGFSGKGARIRSLSWLIITALVVNVGGALADGTKARERRAQNRAKIMKYSNKVKRSYEKAGKAINGSKYLEDVQKLPTTKPKNTAGFQERSSQPTQNNGRQPRRLTGQERNVIKNLGWTKRNWERGEHGDRFPSRFPSRNRR